MYFEDVKTSFGGPFPLEELLHTHASNSVKEKFRGGNLIPAKADKKKNTIVIPSDTYDKKSSKLLQYCFITCQIRP